jgi:hypothetical protein
MAGIAMAIRGARITRGQQPVNLLFGLGIPLPLPVHPSPSPIGGTTMADKAARKTPVRTAPQRKDYPSEVAWLEAKLAHVQAEEAKAAEAKVVRVEKRIASVQKTIADYTARLSQLEAERDKLKGIAKTDEG